MIESSATGSAMTSSEAVVLQKVRIAAIELVNTCRFINLDRVRFPTLLMGRRYQLEFPPGNSRDPASREIHNFWPFFPFSRERQGGKPGNSRDFPGNWPILKVPIPGK